MTGPGPGWRNAPFFIPAMNLLFIGDIIASPGRRMVAEHLRELVSWERIDLSIANAENAAGGFGVTPLVAEELFAMGLDVLTSGNHVWDKQRSTITWTASPGCFARPTTRTAPRAGGSIWRARTTASRSR